MQKKQTNESVYDLKSVKLPYLSGLALKLMVSVLEGPFSGLLTRSLFDSAGVSWLREQQVDEPPTNFPLYPAQSSVLPQNPPGPDFWQDKDRQKVILPYRTAADYAEAYQSGALSPVDVAERLIKALEESQAMQPALKAVIKYRKELIMTQAEEAAQRISSGNSRGVFDGVPVAVKDEIDQIGYGTSVGTSFLGKQPVQRDATVVARMRAAGALLFGKTNMHEIGIGVTGLNPHFGTPLNPYLPTHYTGGSSSGSAAAVAAGLCPVAIGADGGGSIRIPAAFCGVVGIKPTFGRISEFGAAPLCWSVAHLGPLAVSASDAAAAYAVMAGVDSNDPNTRYQPEMDWSGWQNTDLRGRKLGVYWPWFRHAAAEVLVTCENMLAVYESLGAEIHEIVLPDLEAARVAHSITIAGEMAQALDRTYARHHREHGLDVRLNLALARKFHTTDYVQAQRVRTRMMHHFKTAFESVDLILTPTTGIAAPPIPSAALRGGESDLSTLVEIMRFVTPANLTGLPAISFPAGYTDEGLPVGLQAIAPAWQEKQLLNLAFLSELHIPRKKPQIFFDLLEYHHDASIVN